MIQKLLSLLLFSSVTLQAKEKPNILFISVDDLNTYSKFQNIYPDALTPNIDRLAKLGLAFESAYCQWPTCGPSRNSVMSGLLPTTIGGKEKLKDTELQTKVHNLGSKLLHEYFSENGYKTMAVGKLCHYHIPKDSASLSGNRGHFSAGLGRMAKNWNSSQTITDWHAVTSLPEDSFPDTKAANWAINQLEQDHDSPFMLMVGFLRPHVPWYVTKQWFDLYNPNKLSLPPFLENDLDDVPFQSKIVNIQSYMPNLRNRKDDKQWREILQAYLASISFMDHQVGRVLTALENSEHKDNTIIVLWSDHGYHMGEKGTFQKHSLWRPACHVPMIMAGPSIPKGQKRKQVVGLIDIYPTLLELAGLPPNSRNEGRSLTPIINQAELEWNYPTVTAWRNGSFALQSNQYRYIRYKDQSEELYDHSKDPNEWENVANDPTYKATKIKLANTLKSLNLKATVSN